MLLTPTAFFENITEQSLYEETKRIWQNNGGRIMKRPENLTRDT